MSGSHQNPTRKLFEWLAKAMQITDWEAIKLVNDFSFDIKNKISASGEANWENVGKFLRDDKGNIILDSTILELKSELPVVAEKVIREKAEHKILVGENEKTILEMEEILLISTPKKDYGWVIAIVLIVLSVMMLGIYLSENGLAPSSTGNQHIIQTR